MLEQSVLGEGPKPGPDLVAAEPAVLQSDPHVLGDRRHDDLRLRQEDDRPGWIS